MGHDDLPWLKPSALDQRGDDTGPAPGHAGARGPTRQHAPHRRYRSDGVRGAGEGLGKGIRALHAPESGPSLGQLFVGYRLPSQHHPLQLGVGQQPCIIGIGELTGCLQTTDHVADHAPFLTAEDEQRRFGLLT